MKKAVIRVFLLGLLTPGFWFLVLNIRTAVVEWMRTPEYISYKVKSVLAVYNLRFVAELVNASALSKLFYNKTSIVANNSSEVLNLISPRTYFADSMVFGVWELIPFVFAPFWFLGVYRLIKGGRWKPFFMLFIFGIFGYLSGQRNVYFLLPAAVVYLYFVERGLGMLYD